VSAVSGFPCPHCGAMITLSPLPKQAWGVYQLLDAAGRVIYVGVTGTPRRRLRDHIREFGDRIANVVWEEVDSRVAALDLETRRIVELRPPLNIAKVP
jgi:excinuclease UvrABC nuclease subunit